jgi:sarcosine oxidase subunit delta
MRIACPFCGERDVSEFLYRGEVRQAPALSQNADAHFDHVYQRDNPRGIVKEHWYHAQGCRSWLIIERDLRTHEIKSAALAK